MTEIDVKLAPGCFGGALLYRASASECSTCVFASRCAPLSATRLAGVRAKLGIKLPKSGTRQGQVTSPVKKEAGTGMALPQKVQELMERVERAGIKITEALRAGKNPFAGNDAFKLLRVTCAVLLIRQTSGIERSTLQAQMAKAFNWKDGTASAQMGQTIQLLEAVGAITNVNGILMLKR
jgi:hypothetical protein